MKIFIQDQRKNFPLHLEQLKHVPVKAYNKDKLPEKETFLPLPDLRPLAQPNVDFLFNYQVFPSYILTFYGEWQQQGRLMQAGDTIVQQVYMPPVSGFSLKLILGVRIREVFNEAARKGFSYETLEGHIETGLSLFSLEEKAGHTVAGIHTWSETGPAIARLTAPLLAHPYQAWCTRAALQNIQRQWVTAL